MMQSFLNALSSWSVPLHLPEEERRVTRALSGIIVLIWMIGLALQVGTGIFFPDVNSGFLHIIGTLTMGSLFCLSLNANGQYRVALVCYLILLAVEVFIPSWTLKTDAPMPYLRYSIACFIGLLVVQVTFVFVKGRSWLLSFFTGIIVVLFFMDSLVVPLFLIEPPRTSFQSYITFKLLFVLLFVALIVYTQMVRRTMSHVDKKQDEIEGKIRDWEEYARQQVRNRRR